MCKSVGNPEPSEMSLKTAFGISELRFRGEDEVDLECRKWGDLRDGGLVQIRGYLREKVKNSERFRPLVVSFNFSLKIRGGLLEVFSILCRWPQKPLGSCFPPPL